MYRSLLVFAIIVLTAAILGGCQSQSMGGKANSSPTPVLAPDTVVPDNWQTYNSGRFGYTFAYPQQWTVLFYDEDNPEIKFGTHVITNYDPETAQQMSDHGVVDWDEVVGREGQPVKIDINVGSDEVMTYQEFLETYRDEADAADTGLKIGSLDTQSYELSGLESGPFKNAYTYIADAPGLNVAVIVYTLEPKPDMSDDTWNTIEAILRSFNF